MNDESHTSWPKIKALLIWNLSKGFKTDNKVPLSEGFLIPSSEIHDANHCGDNLLTKLTAQLKQTFLSSRTSLRSLLSTPQGDCFYGARKQCHFCSLHSVLSADNMLQSGLGLTALKKYYTATDFVISFSLCHNYLLQNGPAWGFSYCELYRGHKLSTKF